jgi:hypothetical protein
VVEPLPASSGGGKGGGGKGGGANSVEGCGGGGLGAYLAT